METQLTGVLETQEPVDNSIETGVLRWGTPGTPTGAAFWQETNDFYGQGVRYDSIETPFITKIPRKKR